MECRQSKPRVWKIYFWPKATSRRRTGSGRWTSCAASRAGELSEILGEDTLKIDREHRILGLRAAAKKSLQTASPSRSLLF